MQLKETPEYSKEDILRVFSDIARGDIDFSKISQNIDEMYLTEEQRETIQAMQEYGLTDIQDVQTLQQRLEKSISDGIFYSADQQDPEKIKRFETIKKAIPQYDELKTVYLQLRQAGLEDELYKDIDLNNISYSELLDRATTILGAKEKAEEQAKIKAEQETEVNEQPEMTSTEELTNNEEKVEHLESLSDDKKETLEINEELQQDEEEKETKVTEEVTKYVTDTEIEIKNIKKDKQAYLEYVETEKEKYEELKANVESMEPDDVTYEDEKNKLEDMEFQLKNMDERLNDFDNRIATKTSELQKVKEKYKGQIDFPEVNDIATEEQIIEDTNINRRTTVIQDEQVYYDDNYSPQYIDYNENYDVSQKYMNGNPATQTNLTVDKWMNRFSKWSSALEKVVQNVKYELVKIKADIVKVINEKLNERSNIRQNNTKEQDENER